MSQFSPLKATTILSDVFPHLKFEQQKLLGPLTTIEIGGPADVFVEITTSADVEAVVKKVKQAGWPLIILGWGSNTLISDEGIRGVVIKNKASEIEILEELPADSTKYQTQLTQPRWQSDQKLGNFTYEFSDLDYSESTATRVAVKIAAGTPLPVAMTTLLQKGITGLQWYSRIPATIGGAIFNNIHGGTHLMSEIVAEVRVIDEQGDVKVLNNSELEFAYDYSRFHHTQEVIIDATFLLYKGNVKLARKVATDWAVRKKLQPQNSLGCVFQNITPEEQQAHNLPTNSVGYIVDKVLDKKGHQIGGAKISDKHAAFIVNEGGATASDFLALMRLMVEGTREKLGIDLKSEIVLRGFEKKDVDFLII